MLGTSQLRCYARTADSHAKRQVVLQVVVSTVAGYDEAKRINEICHGSDKAFVKAETRGVFASVFCDFGENFAVLDTDGEQKQLLVCHKHN